MRSVAILICCLILVACGTSRVVTEEKAETTGESDGMPKMDTVQWVIETSPSPPPIKTSADPKIEGFDGPMRMHVILPLGSEDMYRGEDGDPDEFEEQLLHYYLGFRLAMTEMVEGGQDVYFNIHDTKTKSLDDILQEIKHGDGNVIFGGRGSAEVKKIADFALKEKIYYGSPWLTRLPGDVENPYYIQLNPGLDSYIKRVLADAATNFEPDQITIVSSSKEADRLQRFQDQWRIGMNAREPFQTLVLEDIGDIQDITHEEIRKPEDIRVFILTATSDDMFIHDFLRQINIHEYRDSAYIYGLTSWDSDILSEYKNLFELKLACADFIQSSSGWTDFSDRFFKEYGTLPLNKAVEGYNHMNVMWELVSKYFGLMESLEPVIPPIEGIYTKYNFERTKGLENAGFEQRRNKSNLENTHIYLLEVENYQYKLSE